MLITLFIYPLIWLVRNDFEDNINTYMNRVHRVQRRYGRCFTYFYHVDLCETRIAHSLTQSSYKLQNLKI